MKWTYINDTNPNGLIVLSDQKVIYANKTAKILLEAETDQELYKSLFAKQYKERYFLRKPLGLNEYDITPSPLANLNMFELDIQEYIKKQDLSVVTFGLINLQIKNQLTSPDSRNYLQYNKQKKSHKSERDKMENEINSLLVKGSKIIWKGENAVMICFITIPEEIEQAVTTTFSNITASFLAHQEAT